MQHCIIIHNSLNNNHTHLHTKISQDSCSLVSWEPQCRVYHGIIESQNNRTSKAGKDLRDHTVQSTIYHQHSPLNQVPQYHVSTTHTSDRVPLTSLCKSEDFNNKKNQNCITVASQLNLNYFAYLQNSARTQKFKWEINRGLNERTATVTLSYVRPLVGGHITHLMSQSLLLEEEILSDAST